MTWILYSINILKFYLFLFLIFLFLSFLFYLYSLFIGAIFKRYIFVVYYNSHVICLFDQVLIQKAFVDVIFAFD